jgi:ferrous iron transport protein B
MKVETRTPLVALIGNPNTGKTTVFNALCGTRQRVGNYPGVTVERKSGIASLDGKKYEILDLPGLYSLKAISPDEELAADALMGRISGQPAPDLVVYVLDATNLKRNLLVFAQLAEVGRPVVVALTMTDLLAESGVTLDIGALEKQLGVPVVPVIARDSTGVEILKQAISEALKSPRIPSVKIDLPPKLEKAVSVLNDRLKEFIPISRLESRHAILHPDDPIILELQGRAEALSAIEDARRDAGTCGSGPCHGKTIRLGPLAWQERWKNARNSRKLQGHRSWIGF